MKFEKNKHLVLFALMALAINVPTYADDFGSESSSEEVMEVDTDSDSELINESSDESESDIGEE